MGSYRFKQMVEEYLANHSWRSLFLDPPGLMAIGALALYSVVFFFRPEEAVEWSLVNVPTSVGLSAGVLAILLTALSIVATLSNEEYLLFLETKGILNTIHLQFAYYALVSGSAVVAQLVLSITGATGLTSMQIGPLAMIAFALTIWSVGGAVLTIRTLIRHSILRISFVKTLGPK